MTIRTALLAALLGAVIIVTALAQQASPSRPPNIVLFYVDDLGWTDLGCMGSGYYETPTVDRLAREGMLFTDAYANAPNCAPSRACLMSGLYGPRHGVYTVGKSTRGPAKLRKLVPIANRTDLDQRFVTIAEALKAAGYRTAHMGKWHLGEDPFLQGFDVNVGGNKSGSPRGGYFSPWKNPQLPNGPEGEYLTDRLTDEAVRFIGENSQRPFFLYLAHYAVHTPIQAPADLTAKYRAKPATPEHSNPVYAAMIASTDRSLGRVLAALEANGLTKDTLVIFFSDNGGHGPVTSQKPLRGAKGMLYEGGIRVPMIVKWPGRVRAGSRCAVPVIGTDLYPTFIEAAGAPFPEGFVPDGTSLVSLLSGAADSLPRDALYWHFPAYLQRAGRKGPPFRTRPGSVIRKGRWKLIEYHEDGRRELYDLVADIGESKDLAAAQPEKTAELAAALATWRTEVHAPVPTQPNPRYDPEADAAARGR